AAQTEGAVDGRAPLHEEELGIGIHAALHPATRHCRWPRGTGNLGTSGDGGIRWARAAKDCREAEPEKESMHGAPRKGGRFPFEGTYPTNLVEVTCAARWPPNGSRLSCGALKKNSFLNLRAPPASSAC